MKKESYERTELEIVKFSTTDDILKRSDPDELPFVPSR